MERYPYVKEFSEETSLESDESQSSYGSTGESAEKAVEEVLQTDTEAQHYMSVLGKSLIFKGELSADEDLLIQGRVQGSIKHNASNLTIGVHGDAKADITARKVIVQGKVQGDIRASESLVIEASARVQGNLFAPRISLKEGAKFKGSIDMDVDVESDVGSSSRDFGAAESAKRKSTTSKTTKRPTDAKDGSEAKSEELSGSGISKLLE